MTNTFEKIDRGKYDAKLRLGQETFQNLTANSLSFGLKE